MSQSGSGAPAISPAGRGAIDALIKSAHDAYDSGDFSTALAYWTKIRLAFPSRPEGYWGVGESLRELKRFDEADESLREGSVRFRDNFAIHLSSAWSAAHRGDWATAEQRFRQAEPLSAEPRPALFGLATALFEQGKLLDARRILRTIHVRGDRDSGKLLTLIKERLGEQGKTVRPPPPEASQLADNKESALRRMIGEGRFGEAEALCERMQSRLPGNSVFLVEYARLAQRARQWRVALNRWDAVKTLFPALPAGYVGSARALEELGRSADIQLILGPALRLFPDHFDMVRLDAAAASRTHNWPLALQRFRKLQQLQPLSPEGFVGEVMTLRLSGDRGGAEETASGFVLRFPDSIATLAEQARVSQAKADWTGALERWQVIEGRFGRTVDSATGLCECLIETGALDRANVVLDESLRLFPHEFELMRLNAMLASRQARHDLAEARWRDLAKRHPDSLVASLSYVKELTAQGHLQAAEEVLDAARSGHPDSIQIDIELVRLHAHRRSWTEALTLLADTKRHYPHHYLLAGAITDILWQVRQDMGVEARETGANSIEIPPILLGEDEPAEQSQPKSLLLQFESLGDSCELGMVQRRFGAEPLSLLRWTATPPDRLALAIGERFSAIGDPAQVELDEISGEYVTRIPRYNMFAHTFSLATAMPPDQFHTAQCKRMAYLREKLLEDFESGEKILTYGSASLDEGSIRELHDAVRRIAPRTTLLCVRIASAAHLAGSVVREQGHLLVGAISRFSTTDIAIDEWLSVCRAALELRQTDAIEAG